jgi:hypothetical protein
VEDEGYKGFWAPVLAIEGGFRPSVVGLPVAPEKHALDAWVLECGGIEFGEPLKLFIWL